MVLQSTLVQELVLRGLPSIRVPAKFLRKSVNKECQGVKFPLLPRNHKQFSITLSGQVAVVRHPLIWNTAL